MKDPMIRASRLHLLLLAAVSFLPASLRGQDAPKGAAGFLSTKEAAEAIVDESMEPYFSVPQTLEMIAKTGAPMTGTDLSAQRDECRQRYRDAVREFTDDEKAAITAATEEIREALK